MLASIFLTLVLLFLGYACYSLDTLVLKVRPLGVPYFLLINAFGLTHVWFHLLTLDWQVHQRYEIYRLIGSDIFFTITLWKVILHVADPDMAVEVLSGKDQNGELYPKTAVVGRMMGLFGENVITTEGTVWRGHRRVTAPVIGKSLSIVWEEALAQVKKMLQYYDKQEDIDTSHRDFRRVTLGVISHAGFSKAMDWVPLMAKGVIKSVSISYLRISSGPLLHRVGFWVKMIPFKASREAGGAANKFRFFANEWFEEKKVKVELDNKTALKSSRVDLMESLVRSSNVNEGSTLGTPLLSKSEVIGNAFIFILAGHESTGHTLANAIYFLAMYPEYQVKLQNQIDSVLGRTDHNETSYDKHFDAFSSGWMAAIMLETLRLIPAAVVVVAC
ncbi:cytochrome P450 [Tuber brumale]|nr:cytochrome P450 [Tuber brumale]